LLLLLCAFGLSIMGLTSSADLHAHNSGMSFVLVSARRMSFLRRVQLCVVSSRFRCTAVFAMFEKIEHAPTVRHAWTGNRKKRIVVIRSLPHKYVFVVVFVFCCGNTPIYKGKKARSIAERVYYVSCINSSQKRLIFPILKLSNITIIILTISDGNFKVAKFGRNSVVNSERAIYRRYDSYLLTCAATPVLALGMPHCCSESEVEAAFV
jgi:hypothetical protein